MDQKQTNYIWPGNINIIVKKLTEEIITEAILTYAEDDAYWLRFHYFAGSIDISILNKLETEDIKEWEQWKKEEN